LQKAVFLNLIVWNFFISGSWGTFFSLGYFIVIHLIISSVVVLLLWLLARIFLRSRKPSHLLLLSILVAYLPPAITVWLTLASPQLLALEFEGLSSLFLVAVLTAAVSFYYWVPLGIVNYYLLLEYSRKVRSLSDTAKNV
jgi:uncharacterized membrane protein